MKYSKFTKYIPKPFVKLIKFVVYESKRRCSNRSTIETQFEYDVVNYNRRHVFFGYYDISPYNLKTDELVFLIIAKNKKKANICLLDVNKNELKKVAESNAWNWQQGSRLRWMPNNSREIVFNDFNGTFYVCNIVNIDTLEKIVINHPIYDISPDGKYGLTVNFERLGVKRPGYGYVCRPYNQSSNDLANEGIDIIRMNDGKSERLLSYSDISSYLGCHNCDYDNNYINHLSFSPDGDRFLFFWLTIRGHYHYADLLVYDLKSKKLISLEQGKKASHYVWIDNDTIICTIIDDKNVCRYIKYSLNSNDKEILVPDILDGDGHPSYLGDNTILTDTYPDKYGYQHLYLVNIKSKQVKKILSVYHNCMRDGELRTDLHPRYSKEKNKVIIDSCRKRYREMIVIKNVPSRI